MTLMHLLTLSLFLVSLATLIACVIVAFIKARRRKQDEQDDYNSHRVFYQKSSSYGHW